MVPRPGVTVVKADLVASDAAVTAALAEATAVFHLAGCPGVRDIGPDVGWRRHCDNVLATAAVLDRVPFDVPVVVTSSSSVYGGSRAGAPLAEGDPVRPRGDYALSKVVAERLCLTRLEAGGIVAVTRPFTVCGEGQPADMALPRWSAAARAGRPLCVFGSLDRTRDITDVRDVARVLIALADRSISGPVNIGTGVGHRLRDLIRVVADVCAAKVETVVVPAAAAEVSDTLADTRRLRALLGLVSHTDLHAVVARQAAAAPTAVAV